MYESVDPIASVIQSIEHEKSQGNYMKAQEIAVQSLATDSSDYRIYEEIADIAIHLGDMDRAEEALHFAGELHPESVTGKYLSGYVANAKGEYVQAIETLAVVNSLIPNNAEVLRNLGWAHVMGGEDTGKGVNLLRRAHALAPEDPLMTEHLAIALMATGSQDEAEKLITETGHDLSSHPRSQTQS